MLALVLEVQAPTGMFQLIIFSVLATTTMLSVTPKHLISSIPVSIANYKLPDWRLRIVTVFPSIVVSAANVSFGEKANVLLGLSFSSKRLEGMISSFVDHS